MIKSGSPTERFETCGSGTYVSGMWFPECGGHVSGRHNSPFQRGRRPVGLEPRGRVHSRVTGASGRLAGVLASVRPWCCPGHRRQGPPRSVAASPPGQAEYASTPCDENGSVSAGARVAEAGHANRARWAKGGRRVWRPRPPCGGFPAGPPGGVIQGEWPAERLRKRRVGAPASTQGPREAG